MKAGATLALLAVLVLGGVGCGAAPLALPAPPDATLEPHLGARLPLQLPVRASDGRAAPLARYFGDGRAVVLVPGYYRCTQLCGLVMHGVLEALAATGLRSSDWRVVGFSIDPGDTPAEAHQREEVDRGYARFLALGGADTALDLLTADPPVVRTLTAAVGFAAQAAPDGRSIDHAAGFAVVTPDGRIARYFPGIRYDARALRLALVEASDGRIGSLGDRLALLCSHYDPATGRYSAAVMEGLRAVGTAGVLAGAVWIWRRRRPPAAGARRP